MATARVAVLALLTVVAACGDDATEVTAREPPADQRYEASGLVLESQDHGPQLCSSSNDSYPPQCGGADVVGWSWAEVEGEEAASGTTWGSYRVVGTWDGERLTLTEPPGPPAPGPAGFARDFSTPCPPPSDGWAVVDPATATEAGLQAASAYAETQPEHAGLWLDQSANENAHGEGMNDPTRLVLNVRFTADLDRHEAALRAVWGGALCVSQAERTSADLRAIQQGLIEELDADGAGVDVTTGTVQVQVMVADPAIQRDLDERYGEGTVVLTGFLQPVGG